MAECVCGAQVDAHGPNSECRYARGSLPAWGEPIRRRWFEYKHCANYSLGLNDLGADGWRVVPGILEDGEVLMERELETDT